MCLHDAEVVQLVVKKEEKKKTKPLKRDRNGFAASGDDKSFCGAAAPAGTARLAGKIQEAQNQGKLTVSGTRVLLPSKGDF